MHIPFVKNPLPAFLALFLGVFPQLFSLATANVVLMYDFDDQNDQFELVPEFSDLALTPLEWTTQSTTLRDFGGNPGRAMASSGFSQANAFELVVNIGAGLQLTLDNVSFDQMASSSGPITWQLRINDELLATGPTSDAFSLESTNLQLDPLSESFTVSIFGHDAASNRGTFRLDNFALSGSLQAVPLPPALPLMVVSLLGLNAIRRRCQASALSARSALG